MLNNGYFPPWLSTPLRELTPCVEEGCVPPGGPAEAFSASGRVCLCPEAHPAAEANASGPSAMP